MKKNTNRIGQRICLLLGCGLLAAGVVLLIWWQWNIHSWDQKTQEYVQTLQQLIPEPQGALPEERRDNTMAVLSLDGIDFVGILDLPRFDSTLPVGNPWGSVRKYPCRYDGSIYDGTMQIGATSQRGQYDRYREISVGDLLTYTDMEGNRYPYIVTNLRYTNHADQAALSKEEADLTLFIKNMYGMEYLVVFCQVFGPN